MTPTLAKPDEALSLTGFRAMDFSDAPLAIVNPHANPLDGVAWAVEELEHLIFWLDILACSKADSPVDPAELCGRIQVPIERMHTVLERCLAVMAQAEVQP